jgi:hypothetical protein
LDTDGQPILALELVSGSRKEYFEHLGKYESDFEDVMLVLADALQEYLEEERRKAAWAPTDRETKPRALASPLRS